MAAWSTSQAVRAIDQREKDMESHRKEVFEASKFDPKQQRFGLFSYPGPLSVGCDAAAEKFLKKRKEDGTVELREKNFVTKQPIKGTSNDVLFSAPPYVADSYAPPMSLQERLKPAAKTDFQTSAGPYQPHGTFHEAPFPYEHMPSGAQQSPNKRGKDGKVTTGPKNFLTANLKKGNPNSTPGLTIGQNYPHMADPYDRKEEMLREERARTRAKILGDAAFKTRSYSGNNFTGGPELYHEEDARKGRRRPTSTTASVRHPSPWRPNNPPKWGIHDKSIGRFPEHMPSPPMEQQMRKSLDVPWRSNNTGSKSRCEGEVEWAVGRREIVMEDHSSSLQDILAGLDDSFKEKGDSFLAGEDEDRDTFPVTNHSYRLQIAHLEGRLRDYADQLQVKEREIALAKTVQQPSALHLDADPSKDTRPMHFEEANKHLRGISYLRTEVDRLKRELIHAQRTKSALEGKYNEAALRLAALEKADESNTQGEEGEKMKEMLRKVELFKHANADLHSQVASLAASLLEAQNERERLRTAVIPELQRSIAMLKVEVQKLESELADLRGAPACRGRTKESHVSILELEGVCRTTQTPVMEIMTDRLDTRACFSPISDNQLSPHRHSPFIKRYSPSIKRASPSGKQSTPPIKHSPSPPRRMTPSLFRKSVPGSQLGVLDFRKPLFRTFKKSSKVITSRPAGLLGHNRRRRGGKEDKFADLFPVENEMQ